MPDIKLTKFTYDHRGRMQSETTTLNDGEPAEVHYEYDELGRLAGKSYGNRDSFDAVSLADLEVGTNIRGWTFEILNTTLDPTTATGQLTVNGNIALNKTYDPDFFINDIKYYDNVFCVTPGNPNGYEAIYEFGDWDKAQITVKNDKDYIVTANTLPKGDENSWGFERSRLVATHPMSMEQIQVGTDIRGWEFVVEKGVNEGMFHGVGAGGLYVNGQEVGWWNVAIPPSTGSAGLYLESWLSPSGVVLDFSQDTHIGYRFKINDDKPYIVTANTLSAGTMNAWGFRAVKVVKIPGSEPEPDETYTYNIQGWLTGQKSDVFDMELRYFDPEKPDTSPSYTGNITEWEWAHKDPSDPADTKNTYAFSYDGLSRLTDSRRFEGSSFEPVNSFTERGLGYDKNGNILALKRYGDAEALVDDIVIVPENYDGNQIISAVNNGVSYDYDYDSNGNMTTDGLNALRLEYNFLNLTSRARDLSDNVLASYSWLADGTKAGVRDAAGEQGFEYVGSLIYRRTADGLELESAGFGGGRIEVSEGSGGAIYTPHYFITDHLGSTRAVVTPDGAGGFTVLEQNDFMPFGMQWQNPNAQISDNRWLYNGKEKQTIGLPDGTHFLDYGARMYDPHLGRWTGPDPLAEKYFGISPYVYCANNPVRLVDLNGMEFTDAALNWIERLKEEIMRRQANNNIDIALVQARLDAGGLSQRQMDRLNRQIDRHQNANANLNVVMNEIGTLAASDQIYDIYDDTSMNTQEEYRSGAVFNFENGNFDIKMGSNDLSTLAHELKHAYQFETGAYSSSNFKDGSPFYDKSDEIEAYNRGALFGGSTYTIHNLPAIYAPFQDGPVNATNHPQIGRILNDQATLRNMINRFSPNIRMAFRVNGVTYTTK